MQNVGSPPENRRRSGGDGIGETHISEPVRAWRRHLATRSTAFRYGMGNDDPGKQI